MPRRPSTTADALPWILGLLLLAASGPQPLLAQEATQGGSPVPVVVAVRLTREETITIDGRLDEPAWRRATPTTGFRQQDPQNGAPATEPTEVRILFDEHRLLLGVTCVDSEPDHLYANQLQRDQDLGADDSFMFVIDTYRDGRSGYYFEINPAGAMGDGLVVPGGDSGGAGGISINKSWDGIWIARVVRSDIGWTAEIEIPFHTVNFDPHKTSWGINFQRTVRRKNEQSLWTASARNEGLTYMPAEGRLEGLEGLSQGLGLDLRPYAIGSSGAAPGRGDPSVTTHGSYGGDLFYSLTPSLRANLSLNTDFAETEVDDRQVNLTRFPLFFPEKRAFFLEGSSFFDFAREPGNDIVPFFSRRIGLDAEGVPQPIGYGAKLTGQAGAFDVGVLQVRTRDQADRVGEDFSVLRVRRRFWRQSYAGAIYTRRAGDGMPSRQTAGVDLVLGTSHFLGTQVLELSGFYLDTTKDSGTHGGAAFGGRINLPNDPWTFNMSVQEVQDGYDPAVGFVERVGYRRVNPDLRYAVHPVHSQYLRRVSWEAGVDLRYDLDGRLESRDPDLQLVRVQLNSNDVFEVHLLPIRERLPSDFEIAPGVTLPAGGDYRFLRRQYSVQSASQRLLAVTMTYEDGPFYSGDRRQISGTLSVRPARGWLLSLGTDYNDVGLTEGAFTTRVWRTDLSTQFGPFVSLVNRIQYRLAQPAAWLAGAIPLDRQAR